jgi:hypothetical protein
MEPNFFKNPIMDTNNNPIYVIPQGTPLYRGESSINEPTYNLTESKFPTFFGFVKDDIEKNYGITYEFTTKQEIRCIAIDLLNEGSPFYVNSSRKIKTILENNYGLLNKERVSESDNDKTLANYVCDLGYDGYAIQNMDTKFDTFHAEIALCNASIKLNQPGVRVTSPEKAKQLKEESILIKNKPTKQSRRVYEDNSPVKPMNGLFDSFSSPPSSPMRPIRPISFETPDRGGLNKKRKTGKKKRTMGKRGLNKNKTNKREKTEKSNKK